MTAPATSRHTSTEPSIGPAEHPISVQLNPTRGPGPWAGLTDPESRGPVYLGVLCCLVGFVVLGVGWLEVAYQTDVWKQMPYLMSASFPGLALVMVGLVAINIATRRRESAERNRRLSDVADALQQLRDGVSVQ